VSSGFRDVARRRSSSSSSVQLLRMAPGSEGAPTEHSVMEPDDGDGSEYIPVSFLAREVLRIFCLECGCYLYVYTTKHLTL
jgi:hypothetical protein